MTVLLLLALLKVLPSALAATSRCYYPDGEESTDSPCNPAADESACCGGSLGSLCVANKLCQSSSGNIIRGSCTDQNWDSPDCPKFCLSAKFGGTDLISCENVTNTDTSYCCDHTTNCCDTGVGRFNVLPADPQPWATWNVASSQFVVVGTMFASTTTTAATVTSTTSPSGSTATSSQPSPTSSSSSSDASSGLSTGAQAGIGVGVGVGAILVAAVIYMLWRLRKVEQAQQKSEPIPSSPPPNEQQPSEYTSQTYAGGSQYSGPITNWQQQHMQYYDPAGQPKDEVAEIQTTGALNGHEPSEVPGHSMERSELPGTSPTPR